MEWVLDFPASACNHKIPSLHNTIVNQKAESTDSLHALLDLFPSTDDLSDCDDSSPTSFPRPKKLKMRPAPRRGPEIFYEGGKRGAAGRGGSGHSRRPFHSCTTFTIIIQDQFLSICYMDGIFVLGLHTNWVGCFLTPPRR
jgi:hypothetical protein